MYSQAKRLLFRMITKVARLTLRVLPVRRLDGGSRLYERAYRMTRPSGTDEIEVTAHGLTLLGPAEDRFMMPGLYGGYYEETEFALFEKLAGASQVIVDVGANIGLYACAGARRLPSNGRMIAFEPVPLSIDFLRRNVDRNGLAGRVEIVEAAAGREPGEVVIHLAPENIGFASASTQRADYLGSTQSVSAPVMALDDYFREHPSLVPDIVKTDTEGFDGFVLEGAAETIKRDHPTVFVEFLPRWLAECDYDPSDLVALLFNNYEHVFAVDEYCGRISRCTREALLSFGPRGNFHCANLIASARPDHLRIIESLNPHPQLCSRVTN